jgi:hypothetical protein
VSCWRGSDRSWRTLPNDVRETAARLKTSHRKSASIAGQTEDAHKRAIWEMGVNWARATCSDILLQSLMYVIAENIFRILLKASFHVSLLFEVMLYYVIHLLLAFHKPWGRAVA